MIGLWPPRILCSSVPNLWRYIGTKPFTEQRALIIIQIVQISKQALTTNRYNAEPIQMIPFLSSSTLLYHEKFAITGPERGQQACDNYDNGPGPVYI